MWGKTSTVTYNAPDAIGVPEQQPKYYGEPLVLSDGAPFKDGYVFKGWATSSGGAIALNPGDIYEANTDLTLYAVWAREADLSSLNTAILQFKAKPNDNYTDSSWAAFQAALRAAEVLAEEPAPTQQEVNNVLAALNNAVAGLTKKTTPQPNPVKKIFSTKYDATFLNWILFFVCFGWIWMWF